MKIWPAISLESFDVGFHSVSPSGKGCKKRKGKKTLLLVSVHIAQNNSFFQKKNSLPYISSQTNNKKSLTQMAESSKRPSSNK